MDSSASSLVGNMYWILRHGKSIPNERGLIVSSMENGVLSDYQLAPDGVAQAQLAGELFLEQLKERDIQLDKVRICYSPFSRTTHTARVVAGVLNLPFHPPHCTMMEALRERYFGPTFELQSHDKYHEIWALDEKDPFLRPPGGESVDDVVSRLSTAIDSMEADFQRCCRTLSIQPCISSQEETVFWRTGFRRAGLLLSYHSTASLLCSPGNSDLSSDSTLLSVLICL